MWMRSIRQPILEPLGVIQDACTLCGTPRDRPNAACIAEHPTAGTYRPAADGPWSRLRLALWPPACGKHRRL